MRRFIGVGLLLVLGVFFSLNAPAKADCVRSGTTVTCTGPDGDGFTGGDNLTVTIDTSAFVQSIYDGTADPTCPDFRAGINVGQNAQISQRGQLLGSGNCGVGIIAGNGLVLTNDGEIRTDGEVAFGVLAANRFDITNRATIRTVDTGSVGVAVGDNGKFLNAAAGLIRTTGGDSSGIVVENGNFVTNDGQIITLGSGSFGIDVLASNTIVNTGTITTSGIAAAGVRLRGAANIVTNRGTISSLPNATPRDREDSIGIDSEGDRNDITNSGTVTGDYAGVLLSGNASKLNNTGTITARALSAASTTGGAIVVTNSAGPIVNSGVIQGLGTVAIRTGLNSRLSLTNTGRIDGDIIMGASGGSVTMGTGGVVNGTIFGAADNNSILGLIGSGTLSNPIINMGSLQQVGAGEWTLGRRYDFRFVTMVADNATLTLTDGMRVNGAFFAQRGRLAGVGAIIPITPGLSPSLVLQNTLAPGLNSTAGGVLSIQGTARFELASRVELDVSATANDRFNVAGTLRSGSTLAITYGGVPVRDGQTFTLLTASSIAGLNNQTCTVDLQEGPGTGCFSLSDNSPVFVRSSATVSATSVTLRVQRQPYSSIAQTSEERGLAAFFDRAVALGSNPQGFISLLDQQTESEAHATLSGLSTDLPTAAQTWGVLAGQTITNTLSPWLELAPIDSPQGQWRAWGSLFARTGENGPKVNSDSFDYDIKGAVTGADYAIADGSRIGVMAARADGETQFVAGPARGKLSSTTLGIYLSQATSAWRFGAGVATVDGKVRTTRVQTIGAVATTLAAQGDTSGESAFVQTSYAMGTEHWLFKPGASLTYVRAKVGALNEGGLGLTTQSARATSLRGDVGLRAIAKPGPVHITLATFWSQNFKGNTRTTRASIASLPGSDFTITGRAEKRGWLNTQAGVNIEIIPGMMARIGWSGILNDKLGGHTGSAGVSYRW